MVSIRELTPDKCIRILADVGCSEEVIKHCTAVAEVAVKIAKKAISARPKTPLAADIDLALVEVGALLHDIGRSRTHGIMHGIEGSRLANELGLPREIISIIERHIGAGLTAEEAQKAGLTPIDYVPRTVEEKIVAHADTLIAHHVKQRVSEAVEKLNAEGHTRAAERVLALHKELSALCGVDLDEL